MQHLKNLANFRANAALGKQGLAKKEHVDVYRCIHTNTCAEHFTVALKQCFQQSFHENSIL